MIIIEPNNKIISDLLAAKVENPTEKINTTLADFDGVLFTVLSESSSTAVSVQMSMKCFKSDLVGLGVAALLLDYYGADVYQTQPADSSSFDVVLTVDVAAINEAMIKKVSMLKTIAMSAPFHAAFNAQLKGESTQLMTINYRQDETMFVKASADRVTVIFSTLFNEETDAIIGKIFLQEFVDCRKQASLQNGPQVLYQTRSEVPMEVRSHYKDSVIPEKMNFVTFVLFPRHYNKPQLKEMTIAMIHYFRSYLHYHIKCSKAYMHSRMRSKVDSWMKVLNRARVESDEKKEKKLASGKTFVRK